MLNITNQQIAQGGQNIGTIHAISVQTGKTLWKYDSRAGALSLLATAGALIFGGDTNGRFRAFDQNTGRVLFEVNLGAPVTGYPVSYSAGGRQYVAVSTGTSLVSSGVNRLAPELKPGTNNSIFVFALEAN
jgi:alcohol dehydrogenase (cytochrome c)